MDLKHPSIPVFYINQNEDADQFDNISIRSPKLGGKGPQYPALKLNVSVY